MYYSTLSEISPSKIDEISGLKIDLCKNLGKPRVCVIHTGMTGLSEIGQDYTKVNALYDLNKRGIIELVIIEMSEPPSENSCTDEVAEFDEDCVTAYKEYNLASFDLLVVGSRGGKYAASLLKKKLWKKPILFFGALKILDCCKYANESQRFVFVHGEHDTTQPCKRMMDMEELDKHKFF